ncbi:sigma-70 family RNA polymerase sigma factor [Brevibacillus brevis]|uniref:sigma-70 family RNA polymerase sigma factor n=1 Tax=Brevibacillus brevis TaxID=1393 RepID=UPI0037C5161D
MALKGVGRGNGRVKKPIKPVREYNPDLGWKDDVIQAHLYLVKIEASRFKSRARKRGISGGDIVGEGIVGLLKAFDRYDATTSKCDFVAFARMEIRNTIRAFFYTDWSVRPAFNVARNVAKVEYFASSGFTSSEIAKIIGEKESIVQETITFSEQTDSLSLDKKMFGQEKEMDDYTSRIPHQDDETYLYVEEFLAKLPDDLCRDIIRLRMDGYEFKEIEAITGWSMTAIRRRRAMILEMVDEDDRIWMTWECTMYKNTYNALTEEIYNELVAQGLTHKEIGKLYNRPKHSVTKLKQKWKKQKSVV